MDPPEAIRPAIEKAREVRNAEELRQYHSRAFMQIIREIVVTDELLTWAMTATKNNTSDDEHKVALWIIGKVRGQGGLHASG